MLLRLENVPLLVYVGEIHYPITFFPFQVCFSEGKQKGTISDDRLHESGILPKVFHAVLYVILVAMFHFGR